MPSGEIGLVGLGIMGRPMARNMMKAGYSLTVYDIVGSAVEEIVTDGAAGSWTRQLVEASREPLPEPWR